MQQQLFLACHNEQEHPVQAGIQPSYIDVTQSNQAVSCWACKSLPQLLQHPDVLGIMFCLSFAKLPTDLRSASLGGWNVSMQFDRP